MSVKKRKDPDTVAFERWAAGKQLPLGYFKFHPSEEARADVRAVAIGMEIKDMFIEAARMPDSPRSKHIASDDGFGSRFGTTAIFTHFNYAYPEEWARPLRWHRP